MKKILGGYTIDCDLHRNQLGVIFDPKKSDIEAVISIFSKASGVVCMRINPEPDFGPFELIMYADNGRFLIMLNEKIGGDQNTRTLSNNELGGDFENILGELYPAKAVTYDINLAVKIFNDFNVAGNISCDILI